MASSAAARVTANRSPEPHAPLGEVWTGDPILVMKGSGPNLE
jgi:hypothetical protein